MLFGIIILIGISLLILVHELGHFIAAKQAGLRVDEFGFGFPPRMFSFKKGETTYSFNWIPFGGFVKIYGERESVENVGGVRSIGNDDLNSSKLARPGERSDPTSDEGAIEQAERSNIFDTSRSFSHQRAWTRLTIIAAGVAMNFIAGWLLLSLVFMVGAPQTVVITGVQPESPARVAGLFEGDQVLEYKTAAEFIAATESRRGQEFSFHVKRGGEELSIIAIPREKKVAGEGAIGVMISEAGFSKLPFFTALWEGLKTSIEAMSQILKSFGRLFADVFGHAKITEGVVGPIGSCLLIAINRDDFAKPRDFKRYPVSGVRWRQISFHSY